MRAGGRGSLPGLPRRLWIVPVVLLFLVISVELARYLSASGTERGAVVSLLQAQARGDATAMLDQLDACAKDRACVAQVRRNAARLRAKGQPKILLLESGAAYTLKSSTGLTRVVWSDVKGKGATYVQCVVVRKQWSFLDGAKVSLRRIGPRIGNEASC
ncbi:MAG: hypothetical protein JWN65_1735 [Solirubrobacterales bacterium]|nr:hypothetical protein [Solirubrobacterales bacterium]